MGEHHQGVVEYKTPENGSGKDEVDLIKRKTEEVHQKSKSGDGSYRLTKETLGGTLTGPNK